MAGYVPGVGITKNSSLYAASPQSKAVPSAVRNRPTYSATQNGRSTSYTRNPVPAAQPMPNYAQMISNSPGYPPAAQMAARPDSGAPPDPRWSQGAQPQVPGYLSQRPMPNSMAGVQSAARIAAMDSYQMPSDADLAARGQARNQYQPRNPQSTSPAYDNVQLPPTQYGPNQSTPGVRDQLSMRYDPQSWENATSTPGELQAGVGRRTESTLADIRNNPDRSGARTQYQYSPLAGQAGAYSLLNQQADARKAENAKRFSDGKAREIAALTERAKTNGVSVEQQKLADNKQSGSEASFNNYMRNSRAAGERPMSYQEWVDAGGAKGERSSQLASQAMASRAERMNNPEPRTAKPNYQASAFLNQHYGIPMAMPQDPAMAQNWMQSMAMSGNPVAAGSYRQMVDQQGESMRNANDNLTRMSGYASQVEGARIQADGLLNTQKARIDAELAQRNNPSFPEAVDARSKMDQFHPDTMYRNDYDEKYKSLEASLGPQKAHEEATKYADERRPEHARQYNNYAGVNGAKSYGVTPFDPQSPAPPMPVPKPILPGADTPERQTPSKDQVDAYTRKFRDENNGRDPSPDELNQMLERDKFRPDAAVAPPSVFGRKPTPEEYVSYWTEFKQRHDREPTYDEASKYFGAPLK